MSQIKDLFRKYGKVAVGVHLTVYAASFAGEFRLIVSFLECTESIGYHQQYGFD